MTPVFPEYACILVEGYTESPDYGVLRTEMDGGLAKQRARWSKPIVTREVTIIVKSDEHKEAFDEWAEEKLSGAVGWFNWQVPRSERIVKARIVGGEYQWQEPLGRTWRAVCQLETIGR